MRGPECSQHGALVLDLARGRLDDHEAFIAEQALDECPCCGSWWSTNLEQGPALEISKQVEAVFRSFEPLPRRSLRRPWLAAAAAILVTFGVGGLWFLGMGQYLGERQEQPEHLDHAYPITELVSTERTATEIPGIVFPELDQVTSEVAAAAPAVEPAAASARPAADAGDGVSAISKTVPSATTLIERAFDQASPSDGDVNSDGVIDASDLAAALRRNV